MATSPFLAKPCETKHESTAPIRRRLKVDRVSPDDLAVPWKSFVSSDDWWRPIELRLMFLGKHFNEVVAFGTFKVLDAREVEEEEEVLLKS